MYEVSWPPRQVINVLADRLAIPPGILEDGAWRRFTDVEMPVEDSIVIRCRHDLFGESQRVELLQLVSGFLVGRCVCGICWWAKR